MSDTIQKPAHEEIKEFEQKAQNRLKEGLITWKNHPLINEERKERFRKLYLSALRTCVAQKALKALKWDVSDADIKRCEIRMDVYFYMIIGRFGQAQKKEKLLAGLKKS